METACNHENLNYFMKNYNLSFKELLSDNRSEFKGKNLRHLEEHSFERLPIKIEINGLNPIKFLKNCQRIS